MRVRSIELCFRLFYHHEQLNLNLNQKDCCAYNVNSYIRLEQIVKLSNIILLSLLYKFGSAQAIGSIYWLIVILVLCVYSVKFAICSSKILSWAQFLSLYFLNVDVVFICFKLLSRLLFCFGWLLFGFHVAPRHFYRCDCHCYQSLFWDIFSIVRVK